MFHCSTQHCSPNHRKCYSNVSFCLAAGCKNVAMSMFDSWLYINTDQSASTFCWHRDEILQQREQSMYFLAWVSRKAQTPDLEHSYFESLHLENSYLENLVVEYTKRKALTKSQWHQRACFVLKINIVTQCHGGFSEYFHRRSPYFL